jgi:cell wall-associated NlpC family hydrolase
MTTHGTALLHQGSQGDHVVQVQEKLNELGFPVHAPGDHLPPDGHYGPMTTAAVQAFQADYQLPVTGHIDEHTWNTLFTAEPRHTLAEGQPEHTPTAERLVELCLHHVNDEYVFGTNADHENPDVHTFDCAELISWACAQLGVELPAYSVAQIDAAHRHGLGLSVDQAAHTRGALLFHEAGHNGSHYNHVALSLGTGDRTIEAMDHKHGVMVGKVGERFSQGGLIPGITYGH